ncbi:MAG: endonuclease Q family protein, partial [Patescibacteria group bacterium]
MSKVIHTNNINNLIMRIIADLHIHSKFSRACSKNLTPVNIALAAKRKGLQVVATGDFTHPGWLKMLKDELVSAGNGLYTLKESGDHPRPLLTKEGRKSPSDSPFSKGGEPLFMLATEISCIYKKGGKARRVHHCILAPDFNAVDKIVARLEGMGKNLKSDGRPIIGLDSKDLLKLVLDASDKCMLIPAHAWTPWFAVFGSESGFDSLEECFDELTPHIHAIETGLSSDPSMNWQLKSLDKITLVSNSDAHSPDNLAREANVFEISAQDLSYDEITRIIREKDLKKFLYTIEFFPEEGKYHIDGHRACGVRMMPEETKKNKGLCSKCKKPVTVGVLNRVAQIAERPYEPKNPPPGMIPYKSIVPLREIIAEALDMGKTSKAVDSEYEKIMKNFRSEFSVLLDVDIKDIKDINPDIAEAV